MNTSSYWIDSFSLPNLPPLGSSPTVDVVVIGGGLTGITAAYLLKRTGLTVALVERERCASLDTGHTTAHLTCVTDLRLQQLAHTFGREPARAVWDAGAAAIDQIVNLIRSEDIACDFKWVPAYLHAPKKEDGGAVADRLKKEASVANELGLQATFLDAIPLFGTPGVKFPHQAFFHPRRYLAGLLRSIPGDGSFVFEKTAVEEIQEKPLVVKSGGHQIHCRQVVIATHVPLMGATGLVSAALFQTKLYPYTTYALGAKLSRDSIPEALYWDTNEPYSYLRVERRSDHDYAIFGGQDHKTGQVEDTNERFHLLEKRFLEFAPQAKVDHRWSGQVIETNDGLPYIGKTAENQFVATGFSGNGMTFGTLGAMMAVDSIVGRKNPWQDLFEVHRKKLLGGTWEYLKENADYPYYMLRDRIAGAEGDSLSSLKKGEGKILKLDGKKVAAYRDAKGRVTLCSPICTHLQCIVSWNNAEQTWDCPCHGSRFKATGEVMTGPAEEDLEKLPELAHQSSEHRVAGSE